jgi:hypothetical protein
VGCKQLGFENLKASIFSREKNAAKKHFKIQQKISTQYLILIAQIRKISWGYVNNIKHLSSGKNQDYCLVF